MIPLSPIELTMLTMIREMKPHEQITIVRDKEDSKLAYRIEKRNLYFLAK